MIQRYRRVYGVYGLRIRVFKLNDSEAYFSSSTVFVKGCIPS